MVQVVSFICEGKQSTCRKPQVVAVSQNRFFLKLTFTALFLVQNELVFKLQLATVAWQWLVLHIIFLETTEPNYFKLGWVHIQNCMWQNSPPSKIATITINRNFLKRQNNRPILSCNQLKFEHSLIYIFIHKFRCQIENQWVINHVAGSFESLICIYMALSLV